MAIQVIYPGVYIDEFEPAAPIQGAGTSTAAFLGLNSFGPLNKSTLITSWDAYLKKFAAPPPVPPEDDDYLWYAVRGFFANGGQVCFVTAVSNASPDSVVLRDESARDTITVTARRSGQTTPPIKVLAESTNTVTTVNLFAPNATIANAAANAKSVDVADVATAAQFLAGDEVVINTEPAKVVRTAGKTVYLTDGLQQIYTNATLKLAPLAPFATTFRVTGAAGAAGPAGLVLGSIVTLSQDPGGGGALIKQTTVVTNVRSGRISPALTTYRVTVKDGINGFTLYGTNPIKIQSEEFTVTVSQGNVTFPPYSGLSMDSGHPRYFAAIINNDPSGLIEAEPIVQAIPTALPGNRPKMAVAATAVPLTGGADHNPSTIRGRTKDYEDALDQLRGNKDISLVVVPDRTDAGVQGKMLDHCSTLYDRFAIFDTIKGTQVDGIDPQRNSLENDKGFGALYYPWIEVTSVKTGKRILVPPSGHVAGIYARTDLRRGVFKAPAGTEAIINGALGVDQLLSDAEQGLLNMNGINVIRVFQNGGRPVVWGARTTCKNTNWQYVNIRRLFLFLEESIQSGIRGSVFEPNNQALWQKLKRTITAFLTQQWRDGALFGAKVEDAFYVRIDEALNPDNERALGRLYIEIGVRPSYPAEFIIVRIGIWQGGSEVSEV